MRIILATIARVLFISPSWAGDFNKGVEAYNNGDYATALEEFTPLAEQGDARAQFYLGVIYRNEQEFEASAEWYTLAADQGVAAAQLNLGIIYETGLGVPKNFETAVRYYKLASEQGLAQAQGKLALMFILGRGVEQDDSLALMWLIIAKSNVNAPAELQSEIRLIMKDFMEIISLTDLLKAEQLAIICVRKEYKDC